MLWNHYFSIIYFDFNNFYHIWRRKRNNTVIKSYFFTFNFIAACVIEERILVDGCFIAIDSFLLLIAFDSIEEFWND